MDCRDMTKAQFKKKCEQYGFEYQGFMGYFRIIAFHGGGGRCVSVHNTGSKRRRTWLAYLIAERNKAEAELTTP